ncbi:hypothetical protein SY88_13365 [Clostridiales bacterium PH28_bin88]|nr:hypothetical protein SY88_13365 [Clostridiales bacterium PH28_bin88]
MKILLILPQGAIYRKSGSFKKSLRYAPVALTTLAGLVPQELNAEIRIVDEGVEELDFNTEADLVGITAITGSAPRAYHIAQRFRARGVPVVMGGVHATLMPGEAAKYVDTVVTGFAEESWPRLLRDFKQNKMERLYTQSPHLSLANLPIARRDLLKKEAYITTNSMQATRGCINNCDFCVIPVAWGRRMYFRPVEEVVKEAAELPGKALLFVDPSPIENVEYAKSLFRALIPLKKKWVGLATTKITKDPELLDLATKSGCKGLLIGFESVTQETLRLANKRFNSVNDYSEMVKKLHARGIAIMGCFVFGFDNDDKDVFQRTVEFVDRIRIDLPRYAVLTPFPGTPLYKKLKSEGRILKDNRWSLFDAQHVVFKPAKMTPEELQEGHYWAWRQSYTAGSIFKRLAGSRCLLQVLVPANVGYREYARALPGYTEEVLTEGTWIDVNEPVGGLEGRL